VKILHSHLNRRSFLRQTSLATAGVAGLPASGVHPAGTAFADETQPPNVLFILPDQLRYDALGCNGSPDSITPNLDNLAKNGIRFESPYVTQPVCSACRSSIFTGLYPHKTEVIDNDITLLDHSTCFPKLLHDAGYVTGYVGKWHLGPLGEDLRPQSGIAVKTPPFYYDVWKGFNGRGSLWVGEEMKKWIAPTNSETEIPDFGNDEPGVYRNDAETDQAIDFIRDHHESPFCLIVNSRAPHTPWSAPLENCLRFKDRVKYPTYHAMVNRVDENVGRLVATLEELGIRDNTLIVFTSDHGHNFVYRWNDQPKRCCYDTATRVPLIYHWPEGLRSGVRSQFSSIADIAPTILDLCGVPVPAGIHGQSLKSQMHDATSSGQDSAYIQNIPYRPDHDEHGMYERCLVTREWNLILSSRRPPELYDRQRDPAEMHNCWGKMGLESVQKNLLERLEERAREIDDGLAVSKWLLDKYR
jgi:arylsulfatase A-like enzyme